MTHRPINIFIKNMVCNRCIRAVQTIMDDLELSVKTIELGKVEFNSSQEIDYNTLEALLEKEGFELIDDDSSKVVSAIKAQIIEHVHNQNSETSFIAIPEMLEQNLGKSYAGLSSLFSKVEGRTIEKYLIQQRVEKIKELLVYGEKTISEIAWELGYSSSQYLSSQFKAETGISPSKFRSMIDKKRKPLDEV